MVRTFDRVYLHVEQVVLIEPGAMFYAAAKKGQKPYWLLKDCLRFSSIRVGHRREVSIGYSLHQSVKYHRFVPVLLWKMNHHTDVFCA